MPLSRFVLERLAVPLNRGDFQGFVEAIERLPAEECRILAVLGAGELLRTFQNGDYLNETASLDVLRWLAAFHKTAVEEEA